MRVSCCFLFSLLVFSGTSIAGKPPTEAIRKSKKLAFQQDIAISPSMTSSQLDVPIVNPTTPGTTNPTPYPTMESPPPPSTTEPITNPNPNPNPSPNTNPNPNPNPNTNPNPNPNPNTNPNPNPNPNTNPTPNNPGSSTGSWCVAKPTASPTALQVALDYACGFGGADCSTIQPGASCFEPNTAKDHASYAFNDYYQKNPVPTSCDFGGTAQLTYTDPSSGSCHYASSKTTPNTPPALPPPALTPPTLTPPTPSTLTPVNTPGGQNGFGSEPTDYGAEPTGTPSGTDNLASNIQLLSALVSFMVAVTVTHF